MYMVLSYSSVSVCFVVDFEQLKKCNLKLKSTVQRSRALVDGLTIFGGSWVVVPKLCPPHASLPVCLPDVVVVLLTALHVHRNPLPLAPTSVLAGKSRVQRYRFESPRLI